jgi:GNAT superfamily N-acetyltransferase
VHELPEGYEIRAAAIDDLGPVAAVMQAADVDLTGGSDLDADMIRDLWSSPSIDLALDAWVVSAGGTIVAYAHVQEDGQTRLKGWGDVHPKHRGRGLGSVILERAMSRAVDRFATVPEGMLDLAAADGNEDAAALMRSRGFAYVRSFRHMQVDLDGGLVPASEAPEGIEFRGIDPERDLPEIHGIFVDAFRDEWGYREVSFEEWKANEVDSPSFEPAFWSIAEEGGRPVGAVSGLIWGPVGWVGELGVRGPWRGRGIAAALLRRSFSTFASRGLPRVRLNVDADNPTGAVALYERVGMRKVRGWDIYEKRFA